MDIEKYTRNTYKHVPRGYENTASTIYKLLEKNNNNAVDCIFDAWKLGFEQAYRAAKAGRLDFQQR